MRHALTIAALSAVSLLSVQCASQPVQAQPPPQPGGGLSNGLAFPGAEGFGANASGGRGGRVIVVDTLRPDGEGSLQWAVDQPGARTIVFAVSGLIDTVVTVRHGNVTIAGQTSPGGITLRGLRVENDASICEDDGCPLPPVTPENFVVRFLRLRPGNATDDGLRLHRARNGILDHLSIGNAQDEAVQISFSSDITVQNAIIAETLGSHADLGGMLLNYSDPARGFPLTRLSIHHNLFDRIVGRLPELSRENPGASGTTMQLELSHNLFHDPGYPMWIGMTSEVNAPGGGYLQHPIEYQANIVGNLFDGTPSHFRTGMFTIEGALAPDEGYLPSGTPTRLHLRDNRVNLYPSLRDAQLVYCCNDFADAARDMTMPFASTTPPWVQSTRHPFPAVHFTPVEQLRSELVANAGVFPRDPMDARLLSFVRQGTFDPTPRHVNPAGDTLRLPPSMPAAPRDGDLDGMPDGWEREHGLNPAVPDDKGTGLANGRVGLEGLTNLEVYLDELASERVRGG